MEPTSCPLPQENAVLGEHCCRWDEQAPPGTQLLPGLLLLLWLSAGLAHHGSALWGGPHSHTHGAPRCYSAEELPLGQAPAHLLARAAKWEQTLPVALVSSLEAVGRRRWQERPPAGTQCPVLQPEEVLEADIHQRSISPWRYRVDTDENRYPQKLAVAECLCRGCISARTGRETAALNSVPLHQSLLVLRRRPCSLDASGVPTPGAFAFHAESIRVPIGCTCVLPRVVR
ncbi:Interleukin-17C [Myotis brandtii]|uniref:Interleukin-17C n=1 Tax=Myotis brandtii TaxID=109478 RepID=S7MME5_MYOBR|nr:Interleukin-17C [Myotis brandtii]